MNIPRLAVAILLATTTVPAGATEHNIEGKFNHAGKDVIIYRVGEVYAETGNTDQFAVAVAPTIREYTAKTGFEACANICKNGNRMGARILTIESAAACPQTDICPEGMTPTGTDIHSHAFSDYTPNTTDTLFLAGDYSKRRKKVRTFPEAFSPADYETGPGYLVTATTLRHQKGKNLVRDITIKR